LATEMLMALASSGVVPTANAAAPADFKNWRRETSDGESQSRQMRMCDMGGEPPWYRGFGSELADAAY
jgi:hypothetical protein